MSKNGFIWDDIQIGKLYMSNRTALMGAWRVPYFSIDSRHDKDYNTAKDFVYVSFKKSEPVMVVSKHFDKDSMSSWLKILHGDNAVWIRHEKFLVNLESD